MEDKERHGEKAAQVGAISHKPGWMKGMKGLSWLAAWWSPILIAALCAALISPQAFYGDSIGVIIGAAAGAVIGLFLIGIILALMVALIPWAIMKSRPSWIPSLTAAFIVLLAGLASGDSRHTMCVKYVDAKRAAVDAGEGINFFQRSFEIRMRCDSGLFSLPNAARP